MTLARIAIEHLSRRIAAWAACLLLLGAAALPAGAQTTEYTLANGMKVIVKEDHRAPTVAHMVWYRAGSIDEVNGKTGVAHVLEHMMFKGTRQYGPGEFSKRIAALGGRENAFTSRDYTGYYQQLHKSALAEAMTLESDRMHNLVLSKDEFDKEIKVVMEERRWRTEDRAQSLMMEQLNAAAFVASPYRAPTVGWMNDLEAMTVEDAREWYERWYAPNNALLIVAGDVQPAQVLALAERTYGRLPAKPLPARKPQLEPPQRGIRRLSVKAPADNPMVVLGFQAPVLRDVERDVDPFALEILSAMLALNDTGRFTRRLVREQRVANAAEAGYDMISRGPGLFLLLAVPAEGKTTEDAEGAMRAEIARIAAEGIPEDELRRIKTQYVAAETYKLDSIFAQAMESAQLEITGFAQRDGPRVLERIRAVTSAQIQDVARRYFSDDTLTVVTLLPQPVGGKRAPPPAGLRH
ncbi:MAG: insulinase family protein [Burkholderiaceae bacterium]|nr:insulinase family protein [Burkholderiaceae bacterium]